MKGKPGPKSGRWFALPALLIVLLALGQPALARIQPDAADNVPPAGLLQSTVRMTIETWEVAADESGYVLNAGVGHATVLEGRYLLTHNHFDPPLDNPGLTRLTLFDETGQLLLQTTSFEVVESCEGTQLVDMSPKEGQPTLAMLGRRSAAVAGPLESPPVAGDTVQQVVWDGQQTSLRATTVESLEIVEGIPRLVLPQAIVPGASGGGVFFHGRHIANNWTTRDYLDANDLIFDQDSTAAVNPIAPAGTPSLLTCG